MIDITEQINQGQIALGIVIIAFMLTLITLNFSKKSRSHKRRS